MDWLLTFLAANEIVPPFPLEEPPAPPIEEHNFMAEFLYVLLMLGLLIVTLYLASWFLKRLVNNRSQVINESSDIKVLERRVLSTKTTLYLIEHEDDTFMIAETPTTVVPLTHKKNL